MNQDTLYTWVLRVLRQLQVPFIDPCDPSYAPSAMVNFVSENFTIVTSTNMITLGGNPSLNNLFVFVGGQKIPNNSLTLSGQVLTFNNNTLLSGDMVEVQYPI